LVGQYITRTAICQYCSEAQQYQFASVCVPPYFVSEAAKLLETSSHQPAVCTVVGFPMGYSSLVSKLEEVKRAIGEGASEIDAVLNLCAIRNGDWTYLCNEMDALVLNTHIKGKVIKLILETALLTEIEIAQVGKIALEFQPDFLKTSPVG